MARGRGRRNRRRDESSSSSDSSDSDSSPSSYSSRSRSRTASRSRQRRTRTRSRSPSPPPRRRGISSGRSSPRRGRAASRSPPPGRGRAAPHTPPPGRGRAASRTPPPGVQGLPAAIPQAPNQIVDEVKSLVLDQYATFKEVIEEHKEEVEERFSKTAVKFQNKPIERQFEVNSDFLAQNKKISRALKHKNYKKVKKIVKEQRKALEKHEQDLIIADESEFGWLTVAKIRDKKFLSSSLVRQINKVDSLIAKAKNRNGQAGSGYGKPQGQPPLKPQQNSVVTKRADRKPPEEILHDIAKRQRAGNCSHCNAAGHWYRECPSFWEKVSQSRATWQGQVAGPPEKKEG